MDNFPLLLLVILLIVAFFLVPVALADEEMNPPWDVNCKDLNPYNGFVNDQGVCVPGLVTNETWFVKSPSRFYGLGDSYAPGVMERVCNGRCRNYKDGIALMSCGDIGRTAWLKRPGKKWDGPFLVVDCSHKRHLWMNVVGNGLVVEWGYKTTQRWGQSVVQGILVHLGGKPDDEVWGWYYPYWFEEYALEWIVLDANPKPFYIGIGEIALKP